MTNQPSAAGDMPPAPVRAPRPIVMIGVGNEYRNDDGVGRIVAQQVRRLAPPSVVVLEESGEGVALLHAWEGASLAIICDAVATGAVPGTIYRIEADREPIPISMYRYSSHAFGLADAVALAKMLGELPRRLIIYGIEGGNFTAGTAISPEVAQATAAVVWQVLADLEHLSAG